VGYAGLDSCSLLEPDIAGSVPERNVDAAPTTSYFSDDRALCLGVQVVAEGIDT
jgi:hypothetical protein